MQPEEQRRSQVLLDGTPYLIEDGAAAEQRFSVVSAKGAAIQKRAVTVAASIAEEARRVLPQFEMAIRSDLVAESNRLEGIDSSPKEIRDLVRVRNELLKLDVHSFVQYVRDDPRVLESVGLYRAYAVADEWAATAARPREFELRQLHTLVMPTLKSAGDYKAAPNKIGGSKHTPTEPLDVPVEMADLADWFRDGSGDAVLDAAVAHAWLTHIHPFDDGNGRMARLLANLALVQSHYPPLLLRSGADRGQYLDALSASDDGDILPLYSLFVTSLRRVVCVMEKPNYVEAKLRHELLATASQRHQTWEAQVRAFFTCLDQKCRHTTWSIRLMGLPSLEHFELLEQRDTDGNSWFAKFRHLGIDEWLMWFGYRSTTMVDILGSKHSWPSLFLAQRTSDVSAVHPFESRFEAHNGRPSEICFTPGVQKPVTLRWDHETESMRVDEAAALVVKAICRA